MHIPQTRFGRGARQHAAQPLERDLIAGTNRVEPAFGFFAKILETAVRSELAGHDNLPSECACSPLEYRPEEGPDDLCRIDWVGASSLAADRWRPKAQCGECRTPRRGVSIGTAL
jgi:hypothetical protein